MNNIEKEKNKSSYVYIILLIIFVLFPVPYTLLQMGVFNGKIKIDSVADNCYDRTVRICGNSDNAPYSFIDDYGNPSGFEVELITEIANICKFNPEITLTDSDTCNSALETGIADVVMGHNSIITSPKISTSNITCTDPFTLFGKTKLKSVYEIGNGTVGVLNDSFYTVLAINGPIKSVYSDIEKMFDDLENGRIRYAVAIRSQGFRLISNNDYDDLVEAYEPGLGSILYYSYVSDINNKSLISEMNFVIEELRHSGRIEKLQNKWLSNYYRGYSIWDVISENIFIYLFSAVGIVFFIITVIYSSRIIKLESKSKEKLQRNHEIIDMLSENYIGLFTFNLNTGIGRAISVNDTTFYKIGSINEESDTLYEKLVYFINKYVHPDDKSAMIKMIEPENIKNVLSHTDRINFNFRRSINGTYKYINMVVVRSDKPEKDQENGGLLSKIGHLQKKDKTGRAVSSLNEFVPVNIAIGFIDIDESKQKELVEKEQTSRILNLAEEFDAIYEVNIDTGRYNASKKAGSKKAELLYNISTTNDFFKTYNMNIDSLVFDEDIELMRSIMDRNRLRKRLEKEDSFEVEYRIIEKDTPVWYKMKVTKYGDWERTATIIIGIFNNEKNHRIAEEQKEKLQAALEKAESSSRAKTVFLNNMSHDIRTPMNAIIGFTDMAIKHIDEKENVISYLEKIGRSSEHLLSLINDVLDMSRIESGNMELKEAPENITDIIASQCIINKVDADRKNIDFSIDYSNIKNKYVYCDKLRLTQVLLNVISNAIKYTHVNGNVSVSVNENEITEPEFCEFVFCVSDNGMGMTQDFISKIYKPFTRVNTSTVSGIQGTGLGMAITKNIIDMMHGDIRIESKVDVGTVIFITLRFRKAEQTEDKENEKEIDMFGLKVLLVEDNELNSEIAYDILTDMGLVVETAENGAVATDIIRRSKKGEFDLILMDIQMPIMDGYEATRRIRSLDDKDFAEIPIIAMTANAFDEDREKAIAAGMNEHIAKPIKKEAIVKTLNKVLEKNNDINIIR